MTEPVRISRSATATELAEYLSELGGEIEKRAAAEARKDVANALREQFVNRRNTAVSLDESVIHSLRVSSTTKNLAHLIPVFEASGVPEYFRLGIEFAAAMLRDPELDL